jgi:hypothetical protein
MAEPTTDDRDGTEPDADAAEDETSELATEQPEPAEGDSDEEQRGGGPDRDQLDRLLALVGPRLDEIRVLLDEAGSRWRGDAMRVGEGTRHRLRDLFRELGLVTRAEWDELELRVAQLEHRLRLVEERGDEEEAEWRTSG